MLVSVWFPHVELRTSFCSDVVMACISAESSSGDVSSAGSLHLLQNATLSQHHSSASLWLKHDPWCVTTLYPLPLYPLVVYLYPQRAINPQVKVLPFSPINLPSWATLHWNCKVSAVTRLLSLWDDKLYLIFFHKTVNVLMISPIWVKSFQWGLFHTSGITCAA